MVDDFVTACNFGELTLRPVPRDLIGDRLTVQTVDGYGVGFFPYYGTATASPWSLPTGNTQFHTGRRLFQLADMDGERFIATENDLSPQSPIQRTKLALSKRSKSCEDRRVP